MSSGRRLHKKGGHLKYFKMSIPQSELNRKEIMIGVDGKRHNYKVYGRRARRIYKRMIENGSPTSILPEYLEYRNGGIYTKRLNLTHTRDLQQEYNLNNGDAVIQIRILLNVDEYVDSWGIHRQWYNQFFTIRANEFFEDMTGRNEIIERMVNNLPFPVNEIGWNRMKITTIENVNLNDIAMFGKKLSHQILDEINTDNKKYYQKNGECCIWFLYNELKDVKGFSHLTIKLIKDQFKMINVDYENGITTNNLIDWIKKFTNGFVSLHCLDPRLKRFEKYIGESSHIRKTLIYCMNDGHLYPITNKTFKKSIAQKGRFELKNIRWTLNCEDYKRIRSEKELDKLINGEIDEKHRLIIIDDDKMMTVLCMVINKYQFLMDINIKQSKVVMFIHPTTQQIIIISQNYEERKELCDMLFNKMEGVENFRFKNQSITTIGNSLLEQLVGEIKKSHYNTKTQEIIDDYTPYPMIQRIDEISSDFGVECIDVKRSYTNVMLNNKYDYPIYTPADSFEKFDGKRISCGEYLVEDFEIFNIKFKKAVWNANFINYLIANKFLSKNKIKYVLKPSYKIKADTFKKFVEYVKENIPEKINELKIQKSIINFVIGQFNQHWITSEKGFITSSFEVASGMYHKIKYEEKNECQLDNINDYYFIRETYRKRLQCDNTSIWRHIICGGLINLVKLIENHYDAEKSTLIGVRVDSIYIKKPIKTTPKDLEKLGHRWENEFHIPHIKEHEPRPVFDEKYFKRREWKKTKNEKDVEGKSFCCQGMGGSGKSYLLLENNDDDTIVLSFTNKAINNLRNKNKDINISTLSKYFGHDMDRRRSMKEIKKIQIDEYSMVSMYFWEILYKIKKNNPHIIFEIYGDFNQCRSVEEYKRYFNFFKTDFLKEICDDNLLIKEFRKGCMRYDDELLEELNYLLKHKRLSEKWKNKKIKPNLKHNIVNRNRTRDILIEKYNNKIKIGDRVICEMNLPKQEIYNSEFYIVEDIKKEKRKTLYLITNQVDEKIWIETRMGGKNVFRSGIATTVYKYQGDTIKEAFNIYDINTMSLNELYTAISRGTCFNDVNLNYTDRIFDDEETLHNNRCEKNGYSTEIENQKLTLGYIYKCSVKSLHYIGSTTDTIEKRLKQHLKCKKSPLFQYKKLDWNVKELTKLYFKDKQELIRVEYRYIYIDEDELINTNGERAKKYIEKLKPEIENGAYDENIHQQKFKIIKHKNFYILRIRNKNIKIEKRISFKKDNNKAMKKMSDFKDNLLKEYFDLDHNVDIDRFCLDNNLKIKTKEQENLVRDFIKIYENGLNPIQYSIGNLGIKKIDEIYAFC